MPEPQSFLHSRTRRLIVQLVAAGIVTVILLALIELLSGFILGADRTPPPPKSLRLTDNDAVSSTLAWIDINPVPLVKDVNLLWRNQPLATRTQLINPKVFGRDDKWNIQINSEGFRGPERMFKGQTDGVYRILCVGDSVTFGFNTDQPAPFSRQLETWLQTQYRGRHFEVINAGVPGWSWVQGLRFLELEGLALRPNLVIIAHGSNDQFFPAKITDNERIVRLKRPLARALESANDLLLHTNAYRAVLKFVGPAPQTDYSPGCQRQIHETGSCRRVSVGEIGAAVSEIHWLTSAAGIDLLVLNLDFMETKAALGSSYAAQVAQIPFLDLVEQFRRLRRADESAWAQRLGLKLAEETPHASPGGDKQILFRVFVANPGTMSLRGERFPSETADYFHFEVPLYDDGTHGDEMAGDHVFSALVSVPASTSILHYQYIQDGTPELESLPYPPSAQGYRSIVVIRNVVGPVEVFAEPYLMAERTHPNARGHAIIASSIGAMLPSFQSFRQFVDAPPAKAH